jgi:hypothetical protein
MNLKKNAITLAAAAALTLTAGASWAQDVKGGNSALISSVNGSVSISEFVPAPLPQGIAPACVDFTGLESWDGIDDADNTIIDINIGAGNQLLGVAWDIGIATVGASWLSEPTILHSSSAGSADPNGINLTIGLGDDAAGDQDYSSGGVLLFADVPLAPIVADADGILRLQLFESFDDEADLVDANYRNAAAPFTCPGLALVCSDQAACNAALGAGGPTIPETTPVPVNNPWALGLLALILASLGFVAVRRLA